MVGWGPIGSTPYPGEPGGSPAVITGDEGGLDDPEAILPESAVQLVEPDGTHVAWLPHATTWTYRRDKTGPGSGSVTLKRSDPLAAQAAFPRQLRFYDRGVLRARSLIEPRSGTTVSRSEEKGEEFTVGTPGPLGLTARGRVDPLALDLKPKQSSVRFTPFHPDYDDTVAGWEAAVDVGEFNRPTDWNGGGTNIAGENGTHTSAPEGSVYYRGPDAGFTLASEQTVEFRWHVDNRGKLFLDGAEISDLSNLDQQNFLRTTRVRLHLSAGVHHLAAYGFNQPAESGDNPIALRVVAQAIDGNGQLGSILHSTSTSWKTYEFPLDRPPELLYPGWTAGQILNWFLDRWEARTGLTFARSFTDFEDTAEEPWPIIRDFTAAVGSLYDALQSLAEIHCDLDWSPGEDELHAWVKDTRGTVADVDLPSGYTDEENGCLFEVTHDSEPPICTSALVEWRDGFVIVEDDEAAVIVERKIEAPLVDTAGSAELIGAAAVAVFGVERVKGTAQLRPRSDAQRPGPGFDVADTRNLPSRDLTLAPQVIQSYTHTVDRAGVIRWTIEFGDQLFDQEERFANWVKTLGSGTFGGRTFQANSYRQEIPAAPTNRKRDPLVYHHLSTDATGESDPFPIDDYQTIQAVTVQIPGGEGGTFDLNVNGSTVDTFTISAAVTDPVTEAGLSYKVEPGDSITIDSADAISYVVVVRPV